MHFDRTSRATRPARTHIPGRPRIIAAATIVLSLLALAWLLWPSSLDIANLDSDGTAIIAFGDSLTSGYGASAGEDYPSRLSARTGFPIFNAGLSGDTTDGALRRLGEDVLAANPRIVIVGLGGNDFLRGEPMSATESNLRKVVREIQRAGAMVVLLGFRFPSLTADYEAMYERVAEEERCLLVPDVLDGILGDRRLKSDEIHPNARGYDILAERVAEPLARLIAKADRERRRRSTLAA